MIDNYQPSSYLVIIIAVLIAFVFLPALYILSHCLFLLRKTEILSEYYFVELG